MPEVVEQFPNVSFVLDLLFFSGPLVGWLALLATRARRTLIRRENATARNDSRRVEFRWTAARRLWKDPRSNRARMQSDFLAKLSARCRMEKGRVAFVAEFAINGLITYALRSAFTGAPEGN
jgi:hypothetical protein